MGDAETGENLALHISEWDFNPRLADRIERVEVQDVVRAEVDSTPDRTTPDRIHECAGNKQANVEEKESPSEGEIPSPPVTEEQCAKNKPRSCDGGVNKAKEASI
jgi:hypothetical protein